MLYVFLVDTGSMLTFEMNLAMQRVRDLQDVISRECRIPQEKQVLLISGGDSLDPNERVCRYSAGTDSNPIFLFSKQSLESATPPSVSVDFGSEIHLRERVEDSLTLTSSYETLAARTGLAANFHDVAKDDLQICQRLVFDQHLQHQGWLAVVANLEDVTHAFEANNKLFFRQFDEFLSQREENLKLLECFPAAVELLAKIPLLQSLEAFSLASITSSEIDDRPKTLLEWITAQETNKTLEQMMLKCRSDLEQFEEPVNKNLIQETDSILGQVDNDAMKEVRGLEGRLFQLDYFMQAAAKLVAEQEQIFKSIENNQTTAIHVQDPTVLPELCEIHKHQMPQMLRNHEQLHDMKNKCRCAKVDLSENLHKRLRWVMYVEKGLTEMNNRIFFYKEMLHRLKHHLEIIRQISSSPEAYCRSVVEVVRRKQFSAEFSTFAKSLSEKCGELRREEVARRREFDKFVHRHFLNALFPGLDDIPPSFATKCPEPFDNHLPLLTEQDISTLIEQVPELVESLRIVKSSRMSVADLLPYRAADAPVDESVAKQPLSSSTKAEPIPELRMDVLSQSVEIITAEESRLVTLDAAPATLALPAEASVARAELAGSASGSMEVSPEMEDNPAHDTFMTADFYIDESLPSSMTELASSKKLAELQCVLHDRTTQLEQKEREVLDNRRCIEELTTRILLYEKTTKLMNEAVLSCCAPLKQDMEDVKMSVAVNRSQSLIELSTVSSSLVELVRTWNVTGEQAALDSARSFDESLTAVTERLEAESELLRSCLSENRKLQTMLDERNSSSHVLSDEIGNLKEENDSFRKTVLEIELENEKLQTDYKINSELKDDCIRSLQQAVDDSTSLLKAKNDEVEEFEQKKLESEILRVRDEIRQEQIANEARISEEIKSNLSEKHQREFDEFRDEFQRQLDKEKELVGRLSDDCKSYAEKQNELEVENAVKMEKLQADHNARLREEIERSAVVVEESGRMKSEIDELVAERNERLQLTEELNRVIEERTAKLMESENRKLVECESQTDSSGTSDAESQTDSSGTSDAESQIDSSGTCDAESQIDSKVLASGSSDKSLQTETATQDGIVIAGNGTTDAVNFDPVTHPAKLAKDADVQTEASTVQSVEIQAVSMMQDVEIQIGASTKDVEIQIDPVVESTEVQTEVLSSDFLLSGDIHTDSESASLRKRVESGAESCVLAESGKTGEALETGIYEFHSCSNPSAPAQSEPECGFSLQLRVDDYFPLQRHEEIVAQLRIRLEEEKTAAILSAIDEQCRLNEEVQEELVRKFEEEKLLLEAKRQIIFNEALNRTVADRDSQIDALQRKISELNVAKLDSSSSGGAAAAPAPSLQELSGSRFVQGKLEDELAEAKQEVLRLQSHLRLQGSPSALSAMGRSFMGQSFVPFAEAAALAHDKNVPSSSPSPTKRDSDKFKETLIELSISSSVSDILIQFVSISRCREHDVVFFVWNPDLGHYLAYLIGNQIQHFLHVDSASYMEQQSSVEFKELHKWLVGEVVNHELCLAKKETNRFKVPIGTKFYRVKAKPWTQSNTLS